MAARVNRFSGNALVARVRHDKPVVIPLRSAKMLVSPARPSWLYLYISRLLPDPVMTAARRQFQLLNDPRDASPSWDSVKTGLREATPRSAH